MDPRARGEVNSPLAWPVAGGLLGWSAAAEAPDVGLFFEAAGSDDRRARAALEVLSASWQDGFAALLLDLARFMRSPQRPSATDESAVPPAPGDEDGPSRPPLFGLSSLPPAPADPSSLVRHRLTRFLEKQTGQRFGDDLRAWRRWLWSRPYRPHPDYPAFKAALYGRVDPRMASFFPPGVRSLIRLDEVDWGGVAVNGIPPLHHPPHVPAAEARYLKDSHVVFGMALGGEARAYPKRILAWHELARDRLGGVDLTIVYCTLCGTVIPYDSRAGGRLLTLGTSGLLYRSNKLMFDEETLSLWSTLEGKPVVGALAGSGLQLSAYPVVTTTWGEWRASHPHTTVLSLDTGHTRDYAEGAAYREYFASDRLMFEVPRRDERLKNKAEVLTVLLPPAGALPGAERRALALSADFLSRKRLHALSFAGYDLVVVTSPEGANRVYRAEGIAFAVRLPDGRLQDTSGGTWRVTEEALVQEGSRERRGRVPAWRVFWFAWAAQFPHTELVK